MNIQRTFITNSSFRSESGFTIIELIIASTVFTVVLLLSTFAMIQIGRLYYKGVTSSKTQQTARLVMEEIATNIQFSGGTITATPTDTSVFGSYNFCVGNRRYSYVLDRQLTDGSVASNQSKHVLVVDTLSPCSTTPQTLDGATPLALTSGSRELLSSSMRLYKLTVTNKPTGSGLWEVSIGIVYGDEDLLDATHTSCKGGAGGQFCASSILTTTVQKRI